MQKSEDILYSIHKSINGKIDTNNNDDDIDGNSNTVNHSFLLPIKREKRFSIILTIKMGHS